MDSGSAIIAALLLGICIMPFVVMRINRFKREKRMLAALTTSAKERHCQITQFETCGDFIIGVDNAKGVVLFYKKLKDGEVQQVIDLTEIQRCEVINSTRSVADNNGYLQVVDKLNLSFIPTETTGSPVMLSFFDAAHDMQLGDELRAAEKWARRINDRLEKSQ